MNAMDILSLILSMLACARLTRLVTTDRITAAPRRALLRWLITRHGEDHLLPYLVVCDWCVSVYAGAVTSLGWVLWGDQLWFTGVCLMLASSYVAGALASREGE